MKTIMNIIIFGVYVKRSHYYSPDENDDHFVNDDDHVKSSSKEVII